VIFVGDDWAEAHHDVCVLDEQGARLAKQRLPEGLVASRSCMRCWLSTRLSRARSWSRSRPIAACGSRLCWRPATRSTRSTRWRPVVDRHAVWGAKSDPGDARVLADLVRTDRRQHRVVAADSTLAEALKVLARAHQSLVWARQRQVISCARRCASSTRRHSRRSRASSASATRSRCWHAHRARPRAVCCRC
jgi:hypothetical protein